jgi:hypothetical protein
MRFFSGMSPVADLSISDIPETGPDYRRWITISVIAFQVETITEIEVPWPEAGIPKIVIGWKLGLYEGAGIRAVGLRIMGLRIIGPRIIGPRIAGPLLIQGPVAAGKRRRDQDKLDTIGLFHTGVAGLRTLLNYSSFPVLSVTGSLYPRYSLVIR